MSMPRMMAECMCCEEAADNGNNIFNNKNNMEDMKKGRITPSWIDSLKENEIFVFGSNLAGMHGGELPALPDYISVPSWARV